MKFTVSSGIVRANSYARKMYRVVFSALRKQGIQLPPANVKRAVATLNQLLFDTISDLVEKKDAIRIMISGVVEGEEIKWELASLRVEVFMFDEASTREIRRILSQRKLYPFTTYRTVREDRKTREYELLNEFNQPVGRLVVEEQGDGSLYLKLTLAGVKDRVYEAELPADRAGRTVEDLVSNAILYGKLV